MKKEKNDIKLWLFWFSLAVAIIAAYNILGNLAGVAQIIGNILGAIMPFCIGLLIAYILYMPCRSIETLFKKSKKKSFVNKHARGLSILTTYIIALIVIVIILNVIIPIVVQSLSDLFTNLPGYYNSVTEKINELPEDNILRSEKATEIINNIKNIDFTALFNMERIQQYIKSVISAMETILDAFIAVIVSVYILAQRNAIIRFLSKFTKAVASKNAYEKIKKYFMKSNSVFFKFLTSQVLDAILVSVALSILQVKYAVLLGFMIGLFNLIPYFGAIVAVVIAILITVLTGGIGKALLMTVVVVILQQIDANIINPKIVGDSLEISQLLVIFAVTLGGAYFGVIGMFLAVPVATVIKLIIEDFIEEREKSKGI